MNIKKIILISSAAAVVFSAAALMFAANSSTQAMKPGEVRIDKYISSSDAQAGEYELTLTVRGKGTQRANDVVLLLDTSLSMRENNRIDSLKSAAESFAEGILKEGVSNRLAIVTFDKNGEVLTGFTSSAADISTALGKISLDNCTNIQGGLHAASSLIKESGRRSDPEQGLFVNSSIILIGDGDATASNIPRLTGDIVHISNNNHRVENVSLTGEFDYSKFGYYSTQINVTGYCEREKRDVTVRYNYYIGSEQSADSAVSESDGIKKDGVAIYSVGIQLEPAGSGIKTLDRIQNGGLYNISNLEQLKPLLEELSGSVINAGINAVVTDVIGENFTLVENSAQFNESSNIEYSSAVKTLTWKIGAIKDGVVYTMKYKLRIDKNLPAGEYDTNSSAVLDYLDANSNEAKLIFPVPKVTVGEAPHSLYTVKHLEYGTEIQLVKPEEHSLQIGKEYNTDSFALIISDYDFHSSRPQTVTAAEDGGEITVYYARKTTVISIYHYYEGRQDLNHNRTVDNIAVGTKITAGNYRDEKEGFICSNPDDFITAVKYPDENNTNVLKIYYSEDKTTSSLRVYHIGRYYDESGAQLTDMGAITLHTEDYSEVEKDKVVNSEDFIREFDRFTFDASDPQSLRIQGGYNELRLYYKTTVVTTAPVTEEAPDIEPGEITQPDAQTHEMTDKQTEPQVQTVEETSTLPTASEQTTPQTEAETSLAETEVPQTSSEDTDAPQTEPETTQDTVVPEGDNPNTGIHGTVAAVALAVISAICVCVIIRTVKREY